MINAKKKNIMIISVVMSKTNTNSLTIDHEFRFKKFSAILRICFMIESNGIPSQMHSGLKEPLKSVK